MEIFGIQFAPINIPLSRRLQTLAAGAWFITFAFGGFIGLFLEIYLLFFTKYWWLASIYLLWIYYDRDTCENGGRPLEFVRNWIWWVYFRDYFPLNLTTSTKNLHLNPERNYLFCGFPHGILSTGVFNAFGTNASQCKQLFPLHQPKVVTLSQHFVMPFFRELALSLGGIAATFKSIYNVLIRPDGGNIVVLLPGGAAEAYNCRPGQYKLLLKKRKGFIKLALITGVPLVPVISFGETDVYSQLDGPNLRKFQECLRKYIGMAPVIPVGRGFLQYSFGLLPQRRPITTVVGDPIEVERIEQPTVEQIDELHKKFTEALVKLFEEQKHLYLKNAENIYLEF